MQSVKKIILVFCSALISACGLSPAEGGVGGAVIGAGTGAAIGSSMSNGSIGASAALGAAIGLPAGVLMALAVDAINRPDAEASQTASQIKTNQKKIYRNNEEIEELRQEAKEDGPTGNPPIVNRDQVFTGSTLGNPLR